MKRLAPLLLLAAAPAWAGLGEGHGAGPAASEWELEASRLSCLLTHPVPGVGTARFERPAGGALRFELPLGLRRPAGAVDLISAPPPWDHRREPRRLGEAGIEGGAIRLEEGPARALLAELDRGMVPLFAWREAGDTHVEVRLSPVHGRGLFESFRACTGRLLPAGFTQLRQSLLRFPAGSAELSGEASARLGRIAEYLALDESVTQVTIVGHGDPPPPPPRRELRPRRDQAPPEPPPDPALLAEQRSQAVRDALIARGVQESRLMLRTEPPGPPGPPAERSGRRPAQQAAARTVRITLER